MSKITYEVITNILLIRVCLVKKVALAVLIIVLLYTQSYSVIIDQTVARVNGKAIFLSELEALYKHFTNSKKQYLSKRDFLNQLIKVILLFQVAEDLNQSASEQDVQKELRSLMVRQKVKNMLELKKALMKNGYTSMIPVRFELKKSIVQNKLIRFLITYKKVQIPSESELMKLYKENEDELYKKEEVKIAHIFIKIDNKAPYSEVKEKEKLANNIIFLIRSNKETFGGLAKKYSDDKKSKYKSGLIGWFDKESLSNSSNKYLAAFKLKKGEISSVIWTDKGIGIIKLLDKKSARKISFQEAKTWLRHKILIKKGIKYISKLVQQKEKRSTIEIYF